MAQDEPTKSLAPRPEALPFDPNLPQESVLGRVKRTVGTVFGVGVTLLSALGILGIFVGESRDSIIGKIVLGALLYT